MTKPKPERAQCSHPNQWVLVPSREAFAPSGAHAVQREPKPNRTKTMNTVKLTISGSELDIEYHGSGLILTASLNLDGNHDLRKLIAEMAEWCSRKVASNSNDEPKLRQCPTCFGRDGQHREPCRTTEGYSAQEALDHYPDPPPIKRPTLADFPNGLLGTWWSYLGIGRPNKVILHDGDSIELDSPTAVHGTSLDWLFDVYIQVEAPQEAQDWAQYEPIMDMGEGPSAPVDEVGHHPV